MKQLKLSVFFILMIISSQIYSQVVRGSGNVKTDVRELSGFTELIVQGSFDLVIQQGEQEGVRIETDDNLAELFQTRMDGKKLYINMLADVRKSTVMNVYVSIKELNRIVLLNDIRLKSQSVIHFDELSIFSGGMSEIELEVYAAKLNVQLTDGTYAYFKGFSEYFSAEIHDETEMNALELETNITNVLASGLTEVSVNSQKELKLLVTGSSNIYYTGEPTITERIFSSTGFIVKRKGAKEQ